MLKRQKVKKDLKNVPSPGMPDIKSLKNLPLLMQAG